MGGELRGSMVERRRRPLLIAPMVAITLAVVAPASARTVVLEKTANIKIARIVRDLLAAEGLTVHLTRTRDETLHPSERPGLANRLNADAFISIHNNASTSPKPAGTIVFRSVRDDGSRQLGDRIRDAFREEFGSHRRASLATRRGCCGDYYYQLRLSRMPAVLVEGAFVSNPAEGRALATDPEFRVRIARSITEGILRYQASLLREHAPTLERGLVVPGTHAPVTDARAEVLGANRIEVGWTAVTSASYRIYRDGSLIGEVDGEASEPMRFVDRWVAPGQTYTYQVRTTEPVLVDTARAYRESVAVDVATTTPAISVVLDPGHGGRDPGAVRSYR